MDATPQDLSLHPVRIIYALVNEYLPGRCIIKGEIEVVFDSDDTAWVVPSPRLEFSETVIQLLADTLRPLGIKWMRGWGFGGHEGRVLTANGPMVNLP